MTARVVALGQPANDAERRAFAYLRDHLPDGYVLLHNFELVRNREIFEIDLAILAPHSVFLVDIKGTRGQIDIYGPHWHPSGRAPYHSPLVKLRDHARALKSLICDAFPAVPDMRRVYIHAAVLMTAPDARVVDHGGRDGPDVVYLNRCLAYFQGRTHVPATFTTNITPLQGQIESAICGRARPRRGPLCFREWEVTERLGGSARYTEYRVRHVFLRDRERTAQLRVYPVDPLAVAPERDSERNRISNAFQALSRLPSHPNIVGVRDFFATDDDDAFVLVTEDIPGPALRQVLSKPELARTFDQKVRIVQDMLAALTHAHGHGVVHRNLTPDAIIVGMDGAARLTAFDYARVGENRTNTIAPEITDELDQAYQAPECYRAPQRASPAGDLFATGLICYELLVGQPPFAGHDDITNRQAVFAASPSTLRPELPAALDEWLQRLCAFDPAGRPTSAGEALHELQGILARGGVPEPTPTSDISAAAPVDLRELPAGYRLGDRFVVQERLGKGKFGVVYKVFDTFADIDCALKLITYDRSSTLDRLRQEYRALRHIPEHPNVVKVIWADRFADLGEQPTHYIVMEYIDGLTVQEFIEAQALSWEDARTIARQAADGLAHLHRHNCFHQDIKPSNLLWTDQGVRIIDFNVALSSEETRAHGATLRYLPPDVEPSDALGVAEKIDRDLYALGVTFYQSVTGHHPYAGEDDMLRGQPRDPREIPGCEKLSEAWAQLLLKTVARHRARRFAAADELRAAIDALPPARRLPETSTAALEIADAPALQLLVESPRPNINPFVNHLLTLYSQSRKTNAGTRGLDEIGEAIYVPTLLDQELLPAVLDGEFRLVIITGNAGDGKTAFIQKLERHERVERAGFQRGPNGARFTAGGRLFLSNYDGSQDEGEKTNDEVLLEFLAPFAGSDPCRWPDDQTRLIAINEGRLYDFLTTQRERFPRLSALVRDGLAGRATGDGVVMINLNLRAVVADSAGEHSSIFDRLIRRMVEPHFWQACSGCDLRDRCYIHHNARTLMDPVAGPRVIERLKALYTITHLRGRLHITLRDLRSALAYTLAGTRDCDDVHELYLGADPRRQQIIADGFYFNAWCGGSEESSDRLLALLRQIDVGETSNPDLDRSFDFLEPHAREMARFAFQDRSDFDDRLLAAIFGQLPRQFNRQQQPAAADQHQRYVAMLRRRYYFERRDDLRDERRAARRRPTMLPYRNAERFLELVGVRERDPAEWADETRTILQAINHGEGLSDPTRLGARLALRVRQVERGTARSYRLFDGSAFALALPTIGASARFIEYLPQGLIFSCQLSRGRDAELRINLDVYELLMRLNDGYRPSVEEIEGFYRTLAVFKNVLASAPYEEVMLVEEGGDAFFRLRREASGILALESVTEDD